MSTTLSHHGDIIADIYPSGFAPVAGQDIQLQWDATAGKTVTLVLRSGASNDLKEGSPIAGTSTSPLSKSLRSFFHRR